MSEGPSHQPTDRVIYAAWLIDPPVQRILDALEADGATARFVGGCVRNAILAAGATDLDIAIDRPPSESMRLIEAAGLKAVATGFDHGTVTAVAEAGGAAPTVVEVTSLRRDVATDGRRAVVAFTEDWAEDAARRDFTMNALYADRSGRVFDPLGAGVADLEARRVRFIGAARDRIREDFLRILRYFRFAAWYGRGGEDAHHADDLGAIAAEIGGIARLARERIGHEVRKWLAAPDPSASLAAAAAVGALRASGPFAPDAEASSRVAALVAAERAAGLAPDALRRLAALTPEGGAAELAAALKLSKAETKRLSAILEARALEPAQAGYAHGTDAALQGRALAAARGGPALDAAARAEIARGAAASMPVAAADLIAAGVAPGPALGESLKAMETAWIDSGFTLDRETLLAQRR